MFGKIIVQCMHMALKSISMDAGGAVECKNACNAMGHGLGTEECKNAQMGRSRV
jgi:hypothetical protein